MGYLPFYCSCRKQFIPRRKQGINLLFYTNFKSSYRQIGEIKICQTRNLTAGLLAQVKGR